MVFKYFSMLGVMLGIAGSYGDVRIGWKPAEDYRDVRVNGMNLDRSLNFVKERLGDYVSERAEAYIPEGSTLTLRIVDVDLAGEHEPWWGPQFDDIRIVRSIYPPTVEVAYTLEDENGRIIKEGAETITDINFDFGVNRASLDRFDYEKEMLNTWLRRTFQSD